MAPPTRLLVGQAQVVREAPRHLQQPRSRQSGALRAACATQGRLQVAFSTVPEPIPGSRRRAHASRSSARLPGAKPQRVRSRGCCIRPRPTRQPHLISCRSPLSASVSVSAMAGAALSGSAAGCTALERRALAARRSRSHLKRSIKFPRWRSPRPTAPGIAAGTSSAAWGGDGEPPLPTPGRRHAGLPAASNTGGSCECRAQLRACLSSRASRSCRRDTSSAASSTVCCAFSATL